MPMPIYFKQALTKMSSLWSNLLLPQVALCGKGILCRNVCINNLRIQVASANLEEVFDKALFRGKEIEFFLGRLFILSLMR